MSDQIIGSSFDKNRVVAAKGKRSVAVVLPARNEAATIGSIVSTIAGQLMGPGNVVDDLVVMDDQSIDRTAEIAVAAGARVINTADIAADIVRDPGKGEALWKSLLVTDADIVCWCDADVEGFDGSYVLGLVGALCENEEAVMAKGHYRRPVGGDQDAVGGRVTELVARPLIALLHPELAPFVQPLSGEFAVSRAAIQSIPFCGGYAVDLGLLIDLTAVFGVDSIVAVDLGERRHRPQDLLALGAQATEITAMVLRRAGLEIPRNVELRQPKGTRIVAGSIEDLPPIDQITPKARDDGWNRIAI